MWDYIFYSMELALDVTLGTFFWFVALFLAGASIALVFGLLGAIIVIVTWPFKALKARNKNTTK